jgi:diguanylate cyclase (GGDEF)-like protein/PAS domain S-box-containing protein
LSVQVRVERSENTGVELGARAFDDWSRFAADHAPDALLVVNDDGRLAWGSPAAAMILGHDPEAALGINVFDLVHPDDLGYAAGALHETARKDGFHLPVQIRVAHAAGHWVDVEITANTVIDSVGSRRIILSLRPLDTRLLLPQRRRAFEELLDRVSRRCAGATWQAVAGIVTDSLGQVGEFFSASRVIFALQDHTAQRLRIQAEWSAPDTLPASHISTDAESVIVVDTDDQLVPPRLPFRYTEDVPSAPGSHDAFLAQLGVHSELVVPVAPDDVLLAALAVHWPESGDAHWDDALGTHANALAQVLAATVQRSRSEAVVHHRSLHDPLTGLANRDLLLASIGQALSQLQTDDAGGLALLYCDLDGFKDINDKYSHDAGDRTLIDVANRIRSQIRPGDVVGRMGGDEFVVLCHRITAAHLVDDVARRIRTAVASRPPDGLNDRLDISIGIAWTNQPCDADGLLREADRQMYLVKQAHRDNHRSTPVS